MTAKRKSDSVELLDDGRVKLVFDGVVRTLRRPTVGEIKLFNKTLVELANDQKGVMESKDFSPSDVDVAFSSTLSWWSDVVDTLKGEEDLPAPGDLDDYPMWMMNPDLLVKVQTHWREVPWPSGGN